MRREKGNAGAEQNWKDRNNIARDKLLRMERSSQLPAAHQPNATQAARGQQIVNLARTLRCKSDARVKYRQIAMGEHPRWRIRRGPLPELQRKLVGMATKQERVDRRL